MFGRGLVTAQVALSILLVTSAAVFLSHLSRLRHLDLGFRSDNVLLLNLDPEGSGLKREQFATPYRELLARLETLPGVRSASITACTPIQGCGASRFVTAEGYVERPEERRYTALSWVAPRYFETLGIPLIAGRDFTFSDAQRSRVAIISEAMAGYYFPKGNAIGRHVTLDQDPSSEPYEIVGVVGNAKYTELREPPPRTMYFNMFQEGRFFYQFALRTDGNPAAIAGPARRTIQDVLKTMRLTRVTTLSDQVDAAIVPERLIATLSGFFGVLGAVLAGIGLYGLLAYTVTRRTNEIGVRMALGATTGHVRRLVLRDSLAMVCVGLAAGAALAIWSRPLAVRLIEDLKPEGSTPLALGGAALIAIALLASYVPVRRAARVDPMVALRHD